MGLEFRGLGKFGGLVFCFFFKGLGFGLCLGVRVWGLGFTVGLGFIGFGVLGPFWVSRLVFIFFFKGLVFRVFLG